jgi:methylated-DNA-[protein]-cysteine S-methyltransferase
MSSTALNFTGNIFMTDQFTTYYSSPLGHLKISATDTAVTEVLFCDEPAVQHAGGDMVDTPVMQACVQQLEAYFKGESRSFDLPLAQPGTSFQQTVWKELQKIPYGSTISYLELARRLGNVKAIRAAASSNGKNKIAVIVPCHRVVGSDQRLVGYAGGLSKKRWLLDHELKFAHGKHTLF